MASVSYDHLRIAADGDPKLIALLDARRSRQRKRSKLLTCAACGESEFSCRAPEDICDACLMELWAGWKTQKQEKAASDGIGRVAVTMTSRPHWINYPGLFCQTKLPEDTLRDSIHGHDRDASRFMQALFFSLMKELAGILPPPASKRSHPDPLLACDGRLYGGPEEHVAFITTELRDILRTMWWFMIWLSASSYGDGFDKGTNLIAQMSLGAITADQFNDKVAEQTRQVHRRLDDNSQPAKGGGRNG